MVVTVRAHEGGAQVPVPGVTVRVGRHSVQTGTDGHAGFRLAPGNYRVLASRAGTDSATGRVRVPRPAHHARATRARQPRR